MIGKELHTGKSGKLIPANKKVSGYVRLPQCYNGGNDERITEDTTGGGEAGQKAFFHWPRMQTRTYID